ncbi:bifunctional lysylphosphatidylglycerol flippase/synthetase MprF [Stigmatella sp. ncwal1]|uniref:Bifunctional lysylphosphatidylglycerol flippase/synthetase MprF n=1 Tax=Stigmatella ashevillensis TaxID=2995309 RepID=A0ABT5DGX2_9BACT|nr:bifunctional lysylphosphatidylglycerol flippase/synthetase MprF [Stigmatella ashevillena]MDC0712917.1 bifunctional lysylphosphatidylglycerol flippase/synthetase MprF [Stigmatella ashevillena]
MSVLLKVRRGPVHAMGRLLLGLLPAVLLVVATRVLWHALSALRWADVLREIRAQPAMRLGLAVLATAASYLALTLYDVLALRYVGRRLSYQKVGRISFTACSVGNNLGLSVLGSGSVRYRLYTSEGLASGEIALVAAFCSLTFWVGLLSAGGLGVAWAPEALALLHLSTSTARALGVGMVLLAAGYWLLTVRVHRQASPRGMLARLPVPRVALGQIAVSSMDWSMAALVLYLLLPPEANLSFPGLLALFVTAQVAGIVSQVPGGLGIFEFVILTSLSPRVPVPTVMGMLVVYRLLYYLAPLMLGLGLLAEHELSHRREALARLTEGVRDTLAPLVPPLAAAGCFLAGAILLFSGVTPAEQPRLEFLGRFLPLPLLEASHFLGSLTGMALLLLARGLLRRLDGAFLLAMGLLLAGGLLSLAKGVDYEEATVLFALVLGLLPFRSRFHRHASLFSERFSLPWLGAILAVVTASVWLGFFSYRHVDYSHDLWWHFTLQGDAPRFLRAMVGTVSVALLFSLYTLLQPAPARARPVNGTELAWARPVVARAPESSAHLALVGDKALLFNDAHSAFLMYGVAGRSWVAMGDPVGPEAEATELAWRFHEMADRHDGWTCFYQVGPGALPRYLDMGLALLKLGEEATVPLADFQLETPANRGLRHTHRKMEKEGFSFEVVPREGVAALLPELEAISRSWMEEKHTREKGFSLGYFCPRYLEEGPVALVRRQGSVLGFANVWAPAVRDELSVDLMRHRPEASRGVMDYLFLSLMLWGKEQGYGRFNLGMAPFSGLKSQSLAPLWHRLGTFLFRHGEHFYNFQGVRQYKEKFHPVWTPRYLAAPGGWGLPRVLAHVSSLVSRGITGVVTR